MKHKQFVVVYLLLMFFLGKVTCKLSSKCPRPSVKKRTIIRTDESLNNGAKLIGDDIVSSARECFLSCCNDPSCNVAVMHYKESYNALGETITVKYCFLFACGSPSVCTYEARRRYAIIELAPRRSHVEDVTTTTTASATTNTTAATTTTKPTTMPPTTKIITPSNVGMILHSTVVPTTSNIKVLNTSKVPVSISKEAKSECNEACPYNYDPVCSTDGITYDNKCIFKQTQCKVPSLKMDYDEACRECPPGVPMAMCSDDPCKISSCPSNKDALCKANFCGGCNAVYYDTNGSNVNCSESGVAVSQNHNEESVTVTAADYEETPDEDSLPHIDDDHAKDPYYSGEKRKWLTSKPDNTSGLNSSHSNGPVVVVVKESAVNSLMSLPLLIALIICILLLIGVIYRVKCAPRGRAKKLPVDDGDYLINGMYL